MVEVRYHFGLDRVTLYLGDLDYRSSGDPEYTRQGLVDGPQARFAGWRVVDLEEDEDET